MTAARAMTAGTAGTAGDGYRAAQVAPHVCSALPADPGERQRCRHCPREKAPRIPTPRRAEEGR